MAAPLQTIHRMEVQPLKIITMQTNDLTFIALGFVLAALGLIVIIAFKRKNKKPEPLKPTIFETWQVSGYHPLFGTEVLYKDTKEKQVRKWMKENETILSMHLNIKFERTAVQAF